MVALIFLVYLQVRAQEIRVRVRLDHTHDAGIIFRGEIIVGLRITGRVYQLHFPGLLA